MIKRMLPFALLVLLLAINADAQKTDVKKIRLGIKGGFNLSSFTDDVVPFDPFSKVTSSSRYFENYKRYVRVGLMAGVTADYPITKSFSIAAELLYNARGAAYRVGYGSFTSGSSSNVEGTYNSFRYQVDYVELPVLGQYNFAGQKSKFSFIVYGGIAPALAVKTKRAQLNHDKDGNLTYIDANLDDVNKFNISTITGFQLGGNRKAKLRPFADLRFEYALLPVFNKESLFNNYNLRTHMWTGSLGVGIRF